MDKPKLRPLETLPHKEGGREFLVLRDPHGFSEQTLAVPQPLVFLLTLFDGAHTVADMQTEYARRFGTLLMSDKITEMVEVLDGALMLDNERFRRHREAVEAEFAALSVRPASHAGSAYPGEVEALDEFLGSFFTAPNGPGEPVPGAGAEPVRGLVVPHLDFRRGGTCYAHAYRALAEAPPPDTFVILGISHTYIQNHYVLTRKGFETPFGVCPCDLALTNRVLGGAGIHLLTDEFVHRTEHSVEFQVVFLQHLYDEPQFVPVLCGAFRNADGEPAPPAEAPGVPEFIASLREALTAEGRNVCVIASVDFAHQGRRFGDAVHMTPDFLGRLEREDRETLALAEALDADAFYASATAGGDRRHIDATPAVYTLLQAVQPKRGVLLDYLQSVEREADSVVTCASLAFY